MSDTNHKDRCCVDDGDTDYSRLSKAARIEEYEDRRLALGEEPDLNELLRGLSSRERKDILPDLKLSRLFVDIGIKYRQRRASSMDGSRFRQKESENGGT